MKWLLFVSLFLFLGDENPATFKAAQQSAKENNKLLLLVFSGSDWCRPCMIFDKRVLTEKSFLKYKESALVVFKADFPRNPNKITAEEKEQNQILAEKYNRDGQFPYLVLFDAKGQLLKEKSGGFDTLEELKQWVEN